MFVSGLFLNVGLKIIYHVISEGNIAIVSSNQPWLSSKYNFFFSIYVLPGRVRAYVRALALPFKEATLDRKRKKPKNKENRPRDYRDA